MAGLAEAPVFAPDLLGIPLPATIRPAVPLTDGELIVFSRRNRPFRIELNAQGELEIMSPVGSEGSRIELLVAMQLGIWAESHGGIAFSSAGGFRLADGSVLSPDAAWTSQGEWDALAPEARQSFAPLCPSFLVEVLSLSDSRPLLERKMEIWLANGAQLAWMIDPYRRTVSVYRPGHAVEVLDAPDAVEADAVVPRFRLSTARLWAELAPTSETG